jgi:putative FmdB family regulatory protein
MPTYAYRCRSCGNSWVAMNSISNRKEPEANPCPTCNTLDSVEHYIDGAPSLGDPVRLGFTRPDSGMREVLQKVQSKSPNAEIKDYSMLTRV